MKYKYVFPAGSRCHISSHLKKSILNDFRVIGTPFNGTAITDEGGIYPLKLFIESPDEFIKLYSNTDNWKIEDKISDRDEDVSDDPIVARNMKLNFIRHHLRKDVLSFIENGIKTTRFFHDNKKDILMLIDFGDYLRCTVDQLNELLRTLEDNNVNYLAFIRTNVIGKSNRINNHFSSILPKEHFRETLNFVKNNYNVILSKVSDIEKAYSIFFEIIFNNFFKDDIV